MIHFRILNVILLKDMKTLYDGEKTPIYIQHVDFLNFGHRTGLISEILYITCLILWSHITLKVQGCSLWSVWVWFPLMNVQWSLMIFFLFKKCFLLLVVWLDFVVLWKFLRVHFKSWSCMRMICVITNILEAQSTLRRTDVTMK